MGYTILQHPQITPEKVERPGPQGGIILVDNPARPLLPESAFVVYTPPGYNRFSINPEQRVLLLDDPAGTATMEQISAAFPLLLDSKYNALWQAAHEWEQKFISGVGLSILSLGVSKGLPKASAVAAWSQSLWDEYYRRKALIAFDREMVPADLDFTAAGSMPFSVPELAAEAGL